MKHAFSISSVSVTALVLLTSSLMAPLSASAEERSIAVQAKNKSFRVNDATAENVVSESDQRAKIQEFRVNDDASADDEQQLAETTPPKRPDRPKVKRFRVEDENDQNEQADTQQSEAPKAKQFRVDDEEQQAADAIADDQTEDTQLKPKFKPKAPKPVIEQSEVNEEDEADDQRFDSADQSTDDEADPHVYVGKKVYQVRYPRRYVAYNNYHHVKRQSYVTYDRGSSCHNNNTGY